MSSQRRIQFDEYSRNVSSQRNESDYQSALNNIMRNSTSRALNKRLQEEQRELVIEKTLRISQEAEQKKLEEMKIQQELARHEQLMQRQNYHEQKMRQQIRENNQELRELESKLRQAYVLKGLYVQKKEKEALMLAQKLEEKNENDLKEKERLAYLDEMKNNDAVLREKKKKLREDLMTQIISSHQKRMILFEEFLKEKAYLDEVARRVKEELLEETTRKIKAKERTMRDMEIFKATRQELERLQRIEIEEENERIVEYCQARDKKIEEEEKRQRELEQKRESLNEKMVKELSELMEKRMERERLLQELWAFEQYEKDEENIRNHLEYRLRLRIESRLALEQQLIEQKRQKEQDELNEKTFYENQLQMLAERDKIEQMSNEKRRRKIAEHRKATLEMLEQRKKQRAEALAMEIKLRDAEEQEDKRKQEIVEEERIKIIQEHAKALIGYLPPNILRESDKINFSFAAGKSN